jgi:hypothetical protein
MDMTMTRNDVSLPEMKPSTPTTNQTTTITVTTITTAAAATTYGHWQEGKSGIPPQILVKNKKI